LTEEEEIQRFTDWVQDNLTAWILISDNVKEFMEGCRHYQIPATIMYVQLKLMVTAVESELRKQQGAESFEKAKADTDHIISIVAKRGEEIQHFFEDMVLDMMKKYEGAEKDADKSYR